MDLFAFFQTGTTALLAALHWFSKVGPRFWEKAPGKEVPSQAIVAEPPMVQILEARVVELHGLGDPRWMCLHASWLIVAGCLRHQHLERSHPVSLTASTFHFYCEKGKQAHKRGGFRFAIPAAFSNGWRWSDAWNGGTNLSGCLF